MTEEDEKKCVQIISKIQAKMAAHKRWRDNFVSVDLEDMSFLITKLQMEHMLNDRLSKHLIGLI